MTRRLVFITALTALLAGCDPFAREEAVCDVPSGIPIHVSVRVEPNDTVRVGQTVRLTASVSGNDRATVIWYLWGGTRVGQTVELPAPSAPGTYFGAASAACGVNEGRGNFELVVTP